MSDISESHNYSGEVLTIFGIVNGPRQRILSLNSASQGEFVDLRILLDNGIFSPSFNGYAGQNVSFDLVTKAVTVEPISPLVVQRLPGFIKSEYPIFQNFIHDYYEYLEFDGNFLSTLEKFASELDPRNDSSEYIDLILRELGFTYDQPLKIQKSFLLTFLRDFYRSRGSVRSYEFLFKILYDSGIKISYPRDSLLSCSDSIFSSNIFLFTSAKNINIPKFNRIISSDDIELTGISSKTKISVNKVDLIFSEGIPFLKFQIIQPDINRIRNNEDIFIESNGESFIETHCEVCEISVDNPGTEYKVGDEVVLLGYSIPGRIVVSEIEDGTIEDVFVISPGINYRVGDIIQTSKMITGNNFSAVINSVSFSGGINSIEILSPGSGYNSLPVFFIDSLNGSGAVLQADRSSIGRIKKVVMSEPYVFRNRNSVTAVIKSKSGIGASFSFTASNVFTEVPEFKNSDGFLGINAVVTDSLYHQQFSYNLESEIDSSRYRSMVDDYVHPSGFKRFAILKMNDSESIAIEYDVQWVLSTYRYNKNQLLFPPLDIESTTKISRRFTLKNDDLIFNPIMNLDWLKVSKNMLYDSDYFKYYHLGMFKDNRIYYNETIDPEITRKRYYFDHDSVNYEMTSAFEVCGFVFKKDTLPNTFSTLFRLSSSYSSGSEFGELSIQDSQLKIQSRYYFDEIQSPVNVGLNLSMYLIDDALLDTVEISTKIIIDEMLISSMNLEWNSESRSEYQQVINLATGAEFEFLAYDSYRSESSVISTDFSNSFFLLDKTILNLSMNIIPGIEYFSNEFQNLIGNHNVVDEIVLSLEASFQSLINYKYSISIEISNQDVQIQPITVHHFNDSPVFEYTSSIEVSQI